MTEQQNRTRAEALVYSYDTSIHVNDVRATLQRLVKEDANMRQMRQIFIISAAHGNRNGTVDKLDADMTFKEEELQGADRMCRNVNVRNYHLLTPHRWKELSQKDENAVMLLAWCYSYQWLHNNTQSGNDGRIVMP